MTATDSSLLVAVTSGFPSEQRQAELRVLAEAGWRVTLVAPTDGPRHDEWDDGLRILHVTTVDLMQRARTELAGSGHREGLLGVRPVPPEVDLVWRRELASAARDLPRATRAERLRIDGLRQAQRARRLIGRFARRARIHPAEPRATSKMRERGRGWRERFAELNDLDFTLGPVVDVLAPSVLISLDPDVLPTAARAAARAAAEGQDVVWVHDCRQLPDPRDARDRQAYRQLGREFLPEADLLVLDASQPDPQLTHAHRITPEAGLLSVLGRPPGTATDDVTDTVHGTNSDTETDTPTANATLAGDATGNHVGDAAFAEPAPVRQPLLAIGVTNSAGQGWAWARAARDAVPGLTTEVAAVGEGVFGYPADVLINRNTYARDVTWGLNRRERALQTWTHALVESGRPLFGAIDGMNPRADVAALQGAGVQVGLVFHGSDVRAPAQHARTHRWSPFTDADDPWVIKLQEAADRNLQLVEELGAPVFVSTPDLLTYLPTATWLPVVIDPERFPLTRVDRPRPLVVHAPSSSRLKGTEVVEAAIEPLLDRVDYRRVEGLAHDEARALVAGADIVIDQMLLGLYGVLACEALASGAVVVGHVGSDLRDRAREQDAGEVPIIEATPDDLTDVLAGVIDDLARLRDEADARRDWVCRIHDGTRSGQVLADFINL